MAKIGIIVAFIVATMFAIAVFRIIAIIVSSVAIGLGKNRAIVSIVAIGRGRICAIVSIVAFAIFKSEIEFVF